MDTDTYTADPQTQETEAQHLWDGGKSPMKVSYGKMMMWYFLLSDAFTFGGFLIAYGALRFSVPTWPLPDVVFSTFPGGLHHKPLIFVTFMTFVLILSSVTMVRAVQEGKRENRKGVVKWMLLTIIGGLTFLSCQAWEWTNLIAKEHMSLTTNPFGTHVYDGVYLSEDGKTDAKNEEGAIDAFTAGHTYLIHKVDGEWHKRKFRITDGDLKGEIAQESFGPRAFGALFFFITGFHGFHVFSGVLFLTIIMLNAAGGLYIRRKNGYEMVEKIGLYWHFVDLVWVFVFLVFYLL
ncbi:MAG TPA: cytochrome c oxidase subunit 3 [Saprospiraceae bacterium]|nr:cytochrome c oxidase subunit 3 [Saprospiraceae bacterium]HQW55242.1 cytochrome c oxidase subunit 3 [Saprospiraceae bacterium]